MPCCSLGSILESMSGLSEAPMDVKYNTSFKISCSGEESSSPTVYHVEFDKFSFNRRYSDYDMLCNYFLQRYPYVIVPPLPEKHSLLNYAPIPKVGKEEHLIVEKRKRMLVSFLLRVSIHPVLGKDHIFHRFLENSEPLETICNQEGFPFKVQSKSVASNIISTVVSLTFGPSPPDGTNGNVEVSNRRVEAVVNNIVKTQKLMMKQYQDLSANMIELAGCLNALSLEEDEIGSLLEAIGGSIQGSQTELSTMLEFNQNFYDDLKELLQFTSCLKVVLGNRIELQENLEKTRRELECHQRTVAALESGQSIGPDSFVGKLSKTFKDLTEGGDSVSNRHIALVKSREIIPSLEKNVKKLETDLKTFEESFSKELEYYEEMRLGDWNNILYNYAKSQVAYYENNVAIWTRSVKKVFPK